MPTWTYFVKWLIFVIMFTLSFLLLNPVITTSDPKDRYTWTAQMWLWDTQSHLYHVVKEHAMFLSLLCLFSPLYCIHCLFSLFTCRPTLVTCDIKYQSINQSTCYACMRCGQIVVSMSKLVFLSAFVDNRLNRARRPVCLGLAVGSCFFLSRFADHPLNPPARALTMTT